MSADRNRIESIQALRFAAAALVLLTHITFYINSRVDAGFKLWPQGASGVSLFFVISGVVIYLSASGSPRGSAGASAFLQRRILRIFPLYWLVTTAKLVIALAAPAALIKNQPDLLYLVSSYLLTPVTNTAGAMEPFHGVGWSLIHEMYFYYVFALALLLRVPPVLFCSVVIGALSLAGVFVAPESALAKVCLSEQNLLFIVGMMIARSVRRGAQLDQRVALILLLVGFVVMLSENARGLWFPIFGHFDIGAILVVLAATSITLNRANPIYGAAIRLGDSSYSLYLIHPILAPAVCLVLAKAQFMPMPVVLFVTFAICVAVGHAVFLLIETPLNGRAEAALKRIASREAVTA